MKALWLLLLALALPARAAQELVLIAATNHAAPLSTWRKGELVGGLLKDLGDLLAQELNRHPRYLSRPSKRAPQALRQGEGDLLCYVTPAWIGDDFHFTAPVVPNAYVIAGTASSPPLQRLTQLRGERVGTVLGYRYGELERKAGFVREDAVDMAANLRKLAAGRVRYALTDALSLSGAQRQTPGAGLHLALRLSPFTTQCALSRRSSLAPAELDAAVERLQQSGRLNALLDRYR